MFGMFTMGVLAIGSPAHAQEHIIPACCSCYGCDGCSSTLPAANVRRLQYWQLDSSDDENSQKLSKSDIEVLDRDAMYTNKDWEWLRKKIFETGQTHRRRGVEARERERRKVDREYEAQLNRIKKQKTIGATLDSEEEREEAKRREVEAILFTTTATTTSKRPKVVFFATRKTTTRTWRTTTRKTTTRRVTTTTTTEKPVLNKKLTKRDDFIPLDADTKKSNKKQKRKAGKKTSKCCDFCDDGADEDLAQNDRDAHCIAAAALTGLLAGSWTVVGMIRRR
eukprot:gnl/TRDRNA2_/TRDRNA2_201168_c0_seq1.p1 gnl/TRDRNA2_/TRDRNA2_201168_c0~~gnl/TRDRNA2_/TRDRNA2_201168_c0_seq1.p1  ORF type:complete len:280 (-),score=48.42 gnl/TRDRNA2_/TRDRNA2_201168_c0_seq1:239-1078(-)